MADDPRSRLVARGYDAITDRYATWSAATPDPDRARWVERLSAALPAGSSVLELGCGQGGPSTAALAERFDLLGVDGSVGQIARARANVPEATFQVADMTTVDFEAGRFAGVVALYSIIHVPRDRHAALFRRIHDWLAPDGLFLASLTAADEPGWTGEWLGVPMFFSGFDAAANLALLEAAGLTIEADEIVALHEPEPDGDTHFQWVLARRA